MENNTNTIQIADKTQKTVTCKTYMNALYMNALAEVVLITWRNFESFEEAWEAYQKAQKSKEGGIKCHQNQQ